MTQQQLSDTEQSFNQRLTAQQVRHKQEVVREQEKLKRTEKLLTEEHERGNGLLTRVKDLEVQNSSLRCVIFRKISRNISNSIVAHFFSAFILPFLTPVLNSGL